MIKLISPIALIAMCMCTMTHAQNDQIRLDNERIALSILSMPHSVTHECADSFWLSAGGNVAEYRFSTWTNIASYSADAKLISVVHDNWIWQCGPGGNQWSYLWGGDTLPSSATGYELDLFVQLQLAQLQDTCNEVLMRQILGRLDELSTSKTLPNKWTAFQFRGSSCSHWWGYIHDDSSSFELMRICDTHSNVFQFVDIAENISPRVTLHLYPNAKPTETAAELHLAYPQQPGRQECWPKYEFKAGEWSAMLPPEASPYLQILWRMITPALSGN